MSLVEQELLSDKDDNKNVPLMEQALLSVKDDNSNVPLVVQGLLTLPEHLRSSPGFSGVRVVQSLVFCVACSRSLYFVLFILAIVLSVLRFTLLITRQVYFLLVYEFVLDMETT